MTDRTFLTVVRHGETQWNRQGRMQGHLDSPLTPRGQAQARALAGALAGRAFDAVYSSDLGRAVETARAIVGENADLLLEPRLRERHLGVFQTLSWQQVEAQMPEVLARFRSADADWAIPEGESVRQRYERQIAALDDIAQRHPGRQVLVVAHGGTLDSLMRHVLGLPLAQPRTFSLFNASINVVSRLDGQWRLDLWGDVGHLAALGSLDDE